MQHLHFKTVMRSGLFIMLCLTAFVSTAKAGLDYYEIFIGKKLIFKRYLNESLNLKSLPVDQTNINEQLVIHYYQCNAPNKMGTKRSIALKDDKGNTIKEWKFADGSTSNTGMTIPIKELLQLQKTSKSNTLNLFYAAEGRREGEKLVSISGNSKTVGLLYKKQSRHLETSFQYSKICNAEFTGIASRMPIRINCL
jgi:hypothetical protein